ncbi:hemerythrin domain-containing protein [Microbacterium abyssi]|uniref:hemerythrin domain-containing protein n=1 Tax=Microbacterium abyssi TaxID=2782166 RepID=UPI0018880614|nr:hemerythrin domain-containing protein [Microbacterium sp. A18JL241]
MPCDASGMAEIHRWFKTGFGEGGALVQGVKDGDAAHAEVVAAHLGMLSVGLHGHHEFEDANLWDRLSAQAPPCALHVERMKSQHAQMLVHLDELDAALPGWRATGRSADAKAVLSALSGINAALVAHLPDEEENIVPVMEQVLDQKDMVAASEHGRRSIPRGRNWQAMGAILAAQPDGGDVWLRKNLPAPVRLIWRFVGRPNYAANRRALVEGPH